MLTCVKMWKKKSLNKYETGFVFFFTCQMIEQCDSEEPSTKSSIISAKVLTMRRLYGNCATSSTHTSALVQES